MSLDPSVAVKKIDEGEWKGQRVAPSDRDAWDKQPGELSMLIDEKHPGPVPMSQVSSQVSPDKKWAFVFRWHGLLGLGHEDVPSYRLAPPVVPYRNEYSVELADAVTQRNVVAFHGIFSGVSTTNIADNLGWITNRIFWMPLDSEKQTVLVCDPARFESESR